MESSMVMRDWSSLPSDLVESILEKLDFNFVDVLRFGAACKPWHNITVNRPLISPPPQLPWLLLSSIDTKMETPFRFLNIFDNRTYSLPPPPYPTTSTSRSPSTVNGWLFMFENGLNCYLVNPVTRQQVVLPRVYRDLFLPETRLNFISKFPGQCMKTLIRKAVFSSPPNTIHKDCLVMVITISKHCPLLFCKVGVTDWKRVSEEHSALSYELYQDAIYFKGQFYAVDSYGRIVTCNLTSSSPVTKQVREPDPIKAEITYFVDVSGQLVFISRFKQESSETIAFHLFRQDSSTKEWIRIKTIDDHAIFLGFNNSISLLAFEYSECRGNCIYFTCDELYDPENAEFGDCRIFNLVNGLVEPLLCYSNSELTAQSPVWVQLLLSGRNYNVVTIAFNSVFCCGPYSRKILFSELIVQHTSIQCDSSNQHDLHQRRK